MASKLIEAREKLAAKRDELAKVFAAHPNMDMSAEVVDEIKRRNTELTDLAKAYEGLEELDAIGRKNAEEHERFSKPAGGMVHPGASQEAKAGQQRPREIGQIIRASDEYKAFQAGRVNTAKFELSEAEFKTLITLTTINNVPTRAPGIIMSPQEERTVRDLMLDGMTDNNTLTYMEETTFTNNAATVAEGGTKPESALAFTERTDNVRKIATWIPATRELLADVSGLESYIRGRLTFMVKRTEETQLLTGNGTPPNIMGILNRTGVQTQAKGSDPTPDAVYKAMTLIRINAFAEPTASVWNPTDWQDVRLLRTADGLYIWGNPSDPSAVERIWGLEVRQTTAMTLNTALVGAFRPFAQVFQREGITVTVSTEHSTFFIENKVAILAEERLALAVYRPSAFCTVTGV